MISMPSPQRYTIDASVFLNAFNPAEIGHTESNQFLLAVKQQAVPVIVPTLLFPEVAATISRVRGDEALARSFTSTLRLWPYMIVISLDEILAQEAVEAAINHHLRGSDAVYVAVAARFATTLITLEREQSTRAAGAIVTCNPGEALAQMQKRQAS
jgi:predicted nucleic acid-binding protein